MTLSRKSSNKLITRDSFVAETLEVSHATIRKAATPATWNPGRLYGQNEKVLYLFSVKLSALSVMEDIYRYLQI